MCDDRERLIGYLYDECTAAERRAIDAHLQECGACRDEVRALRDVRADLLAWEVRGAPDVWRPVEAAAPPVSWWRQVPAWAMATAAGLIMIAGISGGVAARAFAPVAPVVPVASVPAAPVTVATHPISAADLAALEQRLNAFVAQELQQRDARSAPQMTRASLTLTAEHQRELRDLKNADRDLFETNTSLYFHFHNQRQQVDARLKALSAQVDALLRNSSAGVSK